MRNIILLCVGAALFVLLILFKLDLSGFVVIVSEKMSWSFYLLICLLINFLLLFRSLRFQALLNNLIDDFKVSFPTSFLLTSASFFVGLATPNKAGDMVRGYFYKSRWQEITAVSLIEYFCDCVVALMVPAIGIIFVYPSYMPYIFFGYFILLLCLIVAFLIFKYFPFQRMMGWIPYFRKNEDAGDILRVYIGKGIRNTFVWFAGFFFTALSYGTYVLIYYLILLRLGSQASPVDAIVSIAAGFFVGSLAFIPMGMGTRDASIYGLLVNVGTDPEIAMSSVIIMRSLSLSVIFVSGICYFISIWRFRHS